MIAYVENSTRPETWAHGTGCSLFVNTAASGWFLWT